MYNGRFCGTQTSIQPPIKLIYIYYTCFLYRNQDVGERKRKQFVKFAIFSQLCYNKGRIAPRPCGGANRRKGNRIITTSLEHPSVNECMKKLEEQAQIATPWAKISAPIKEKAVIKNLQAEGVSVFDQHQMKDRFHQKNRDEIQKDLKAIFDGLNLE